MIRGLRVAAALLCFSVWAGAVERLPLENYARQRQALAAKHSDGVILLFGFTEREGRDSRGPFRQENNFYYLTGWNEPQAVMCLLGAQGEQPYREVLFLPERDPSREPWDGIRTGPEDPNDTGFAEVLDIGKLPEFVAEALANRPHVYTLLPRARPGSAQMRDPDRSEQLAEWAPSVPHTNIRDTIEALRVIKSPEELLLIRKAVEATTAAHLAAWRRIDAGVFEYQVAGAMIEAMMDLGCLRPAYTPIIGGGLRSTILHYPDITGRLEAGDLVVMDVGGEYAHYAADITRTVPASGRFTDRQRQIYEIVLGAQRAAIAAVKPGMTLRGDGPTSLVAIARKFIDAHSPGGEGEQLSRYFIHGIGHQVGLEVHDPARSNQPLEPGMVITIEPGLYIPEEEIGVRIEDMLLVTEDGAEVLSKDLPKHPDDIERIMGGR